MRTESGTRLDFLCRSSNSLRVFSITSRRDFWLARETRAAGSVLATLAMRCSALRSPDSIG